MHQKSENVVRFIAVVLSAGFVDGRSRISWNFVINPVPLCCSNVDLEYKWLIIFNFIWFGILPAPFVSAYGLFHLRLWDKS